MDGGDGITAADNGSGATAGSRGDGFSYFESAFGESRHFEDTHWAVPDDGFGAGNFLSIGVDRFRADIETHPAFGRGGKLPAPKPSSGTAQDRKSTRLNSSHGYISYAVFCLKKKN